MKGSDPTPATLGAYPGCLRWEEEKGLKASGPHWDSEEAGEESSWDLAQDGSTDTHV